MTIRRVRWRNLRPTPGLLWFLLPWLIVCLIPALRNQLRVQAFGSAYANDPLSNVVTPLALNTVLPPTAAELKRRYAAPGKAPNPLIDLKAPENRGDWDLKHETGVRAYEALIKNGAPPWALAGRLRAALRHTPDTLGPTGFENRGLHYQYEGYGYGFRPGAFSLSGRGSWGSDYDYYVESEAVDYTRRRLTKAALKKIDAALQLAQRGAALEPQNAWWDWQIAYLQLLARRDADAETALQSGARKPRFDDHLRDEMRAALVVAKLDRSLEFIEKLSVATRQKVADRRRHRCALVLLSSAVRLEKKRQHALALERYAAIARIARLMREAAVLPGDRFWAAELQMHAWAGQNRPFEFKQKVGKKWVRLTAVWPEDLPYGNTKPGHFAARFANYAAQHGRADLAEEARREGKALTQLFSVLLRAKDTPFLPVAPAALAPVAALRWSTDLLLVQLQVTLVFWCFVGLVLWRKLWWIGRWAARGWHFVSFIWRVRDLPPWDEAPHQLEFSPRDGARAVRFTAAWLLPAAFGATYFSEHLRQFCPQFYQTVLNNRSTPWLISIGTAFVVFVLAPVLVSLLWCGAAALRRYTVLQLPPIRRDDAERVALHVPPSAIPLVTVFMTWSLTAFAALLWLLYYLTMRSPTGIGFTFSAPQFLIDWNASGPLIDWSLRDVGMPIFFSLFALGAWLTKCFWQLHLRRRLPALYLTLTWWRHCLGAWLLIASWLYLCLAIATVPARRPAEAQLNAFLSRTK